MKINKFLIVILFCFLSCKNETIKSKSGLSSINGSEIERVEIKKSLTDTIAVSLNDEQIKKVVQLINESRNSQLMKAGPDYWLFIRLKNDSIKKYKITANHFGENDLYVIMENKEYLKNIFENNTKSKALIDVRYN